MHARDRGAHHLAATIQTKPGSIQFNSVHKRMRR
jgi:hypothetical protein